MNKYLQITLLGLAITLPIVTGQSIRAEEAFQPVELDSFITENRAHAQQVGKKVIFQSRPIAFEARLKRHPEEKEMSYIYTALSVSGVEPMPEVGHRMFIESDAGKIIPVYVEKRAVEIINNGLKENDRTLFECYHVYNYAKGPAVLVVDFKRVD